MSDMSKPKTGKKFPLWARITLGVFVVLIALIVAARLIIGSSIGRGLVESRLEAMSFSGQQVEIDGFEGDILSSASIDRLIVRDTDGVWAEARNVEMSWAPLALIGRRLQLNEIAMSDLEVLRRPILPDTEPEESSSGANPLRSISLSRLNIGRFFLEEGVVQQSVAASVQAGVEWAPDNSLVSVEIEPETDGGDRLVGDVRWGSNRPIEGRLDLDAPAGGLFASLLRVAEGDGVTMNFLAEAENETIDASLVALINGDDWISLSTEPDSGVQRINGQIDLSEHPMTFSQVARLGALIDFSGSLDVSDPLPTLALVARSETLLLEVDGFEESDGGRSAHVRAETNSADRLSGTQLVSLGDVVLDGRLTQDEAQDVSFDGTLSVAEIAAESGSADSLNGPVRVLYSDGVIRVEPQLELSNVRLNTGEDATSFRYVRLRGAGELSLEAMSAQLQNMSVSTPASRVTAAGRLELGEAFSVSLDGDASVNLAEFGAYEQGSLNGRWQIRRPEADNNTGFTLNISGQDLAEADDALAPWLGNSATLRVSGQLRDDGALRVPQLRLETQAAIAEGQFSRSNSGEIVSEIQVMTSPDYPLADFLPGAVIRADVSGPVDALQINANLVGDQLIAGGQSIAQPELMFGGLWQDQTLDGDVQFVGRLEGEPLQLTTNAVMSGVSWRADQLQGMWRELTVSGDVSGNGGDVSSLRVDLDIEGRLPDGLAARSVDLAARVESERVAVSGVIDGVDAGGLRDGELVLDVGGTLDHLNYDLSLDGVTDISGLPQETLIHLAGEARNVALATRSVAGDLAIELGRETIRTSQPFSFNQTETGFDGALRLELFGGEATIDLSEDPSARLLASVSAVELPRLLMATGRAPLNGAIDLSLRLQENGDYLTGTLNGKTADVSLPEADMTPVTFFLAGEIEDETAQIRLRSADGQALSANLEASIPLETRARGLSVAMDDSRTGDFLVTLGGRIDNIAALILPDRTVLTGGIDANLTGQIPFEPDALNGFVRMNDGQFEQGELGAVLQSIGFDVTLNNQTLTLGDLSAVGRSGGTLAGSGSFSLVGDGNSNLRLEANQLVLADRYEGRATASGVFGMELVNDTILVTGDLTLDEGQVYLDRLPTSSSVTTLDVNFGDEEAEEAVEERTVQLDVTFNAPRRLFVTGQGMDAELSLESRITGTVSDIQIDGRADIVRGRFELLGKRFDFVDSTVFLEGAPMDARLDITAERETNELLSRVSITGTPQRPEIELNSVPELPQDEVLSRVLFGRSPSQLTGLEAARLAAALAQMGGGGGFDLLGGIEQLAGLDSLDVRQNNSGQFEVATGRYLSEDVYLEVTSDALGNAGVSVEWEPRENVSVTADTTPGEGENLTIEWTRDFD